MTEMVTTDSIDRKEEREHRHPGPRRRGFLHAGSCPGPRRTHPRVARAGAAAAGRDLADRQGLLGAGAGARMRRGWGPQ